MQTAIDVCLSDFRQLQLARVRIDDRGHAEPTSKCFFQARFHLSRRCNDVRLVNQAEANDPAQAIVHQTLDSTS
jgi:hypothetical protein